MGDKASQKVNTQTHRQTDRHMDISTYRKHRPRGPMLWKGYSGKFMKKGTHKEGKKSMMVKRGKEEQIIVQ